MKLKIAVVFFFVLIACSKPSKITKYRDGKQVLNMNEKTAYGDDLIPAQVDIFMPDTIRVKQETIVKIAISDPDFKLVHGLYKCNISAEALIDTSNYSINKCTTVVPVRNDTMYFAFKPTKIGYSEISNVIVAISEDSDEILRYHPVRFSFVVIE